MANVVASRASWTRRRVLAVVAAVAVVVAVAVGAVLVANGGGDEQTEPAPTTEPVSILPLLGTPGRVPDRAALAVKLDNTDRGRPQVGLTQADVVFEEMVEGGLTRLLAVYHSQDPDTLGPVRSARSSDLPILAELGRPLFAWSGANPTFAAAVRAADIVDVGFSAAPDAYRRADDRRAPYNLFAAPERLREAGAHDEASATPPPALFSYPPADAALSRPGLAPAPGFRTTGARPVRTGIEWSWNADQAGWDRNQNGTPHVDADGEQVRATNVIIRFTPYGDSGVRDSTGAVVPEALSVGEGDAWLLSGGQALQGRWLKPAADAPTTYTDAAGTPLQLAPGPTWVEVLPPATGELC